MDPLKPSPAVFAKLGSIVVHTDEYISTDGHAFDREALEALLASEDVREWIAAAKAIALLPEKRKS